MVILDLVGGLAALAEGDTLTLPVRDDELAVVNLWCDRTGNSVASYGGGLVVVRRGRAPDPLRGVAPDRRPGVRLWMYTNFDCNLACDYCCVRSSPSTPRRALGRDVVQRLALEAPTAGVQQLLLTGGEPFLLPDIADLVNACADSLPTTLLTNGMLFHGRRLERLREMDRRVALQISLDSATPDLHDSHRGEGSWARAVTGVRTAIQMGFRVRVAATLVTPDVAEEKQLRNLLDGLGIAVEDQVLRPLAKRGEATDGLVLSQATLQPEVTVTADGVYWHPVGADDADQLVTTEAFPLVDAIAAVRDRYVGYRRQADDVARTFVCA
ncbi:MAG: Rv1681 family radical SAM protein [Nocardioidaceae bacterium]